MPLIDRRSIQNFDWVLVGLVTLLLAAGLANLHSATTPLDGGLASEMRRQLLRKVQTASWEHNPRWALHSVIPIGPSMAVITSATETRPGLPWIR